MTNRVTFAELAIGKLFRFVYDDPRGVPERRTREDYGRCLKVDPNHYFSFGLNELIRCGAGAEVQTIADADAGSSEDVERVRGAVHTVLDCAEAVTTQTLTDDDDLFSGFNVEIGDACMDLLRAVGRLRRYGGLAALDRIAAQQGVGPVDDVEKLRIEGGEELTEAVEENRIAQGPCLTEEEREAVSDWLFWRRSRERQQGGFVASIELASRALEPVLESLLARAGRCECGKRVEELERRQQAIDSNGHYCDGMADAWSDAQAAVGKQVEAEERIERAIDAIKGGEVVVHSDLLAILESRDEGGDA